MKFLSLLNEKKRLNKIRKSIILKDLHLFEEERRQKLYHLLYPGMEKKFFSMLKRWKRTKSEFPNEIIVGQEVFTGDEVLSGFAKTAFQQSRNPALEKRKVSEHYLNMKSTIQLAEIEASRSNLVIQPMNREIFKKILKKVPRNKAEDVFGNSIENIIYAPQEIQDIIMSIVNDMIQDYRAYSDPMLSISVSSFLYKGKQKPRNMTGSYRKISIGLILSKIADTYLQDTIKTLIRINQSPLQYGFSEGLDYKMCSVLRETATEINTNRKLTTFICASDVSNAFSKTTRCSQLYELWRTGLRGGIFLFSKGTYTNTYTVLKNGQEYSKIIKEECGSKQGGKLSAQDFLCYNSSWSRIIAAGNMGLEIAGIHLGGYVCADDSLSCTMDLGEMMAMSYIYEYYATTFDVAYAFSKTIFNVYNNPDLKTVIMKESLFRLDGIPPLYDESSVHLGLIMTEHLDKVNIRNVSNRIEKTEKKLFAMNFPNPVSNKNVPLSYSAKLHNTFIKPSLTSGLSALTISGKPLTKLINCEKKLIRHMFNLRKQASVLPLYLLLGMVPIQTDLEKESLSLFLNSWSNPENPLTVINKFILKTKRLLC